MLAVLAALFGHARYQEDRSFARYRTLATAVASLGLTDLCVTTEARYTRHPAVSDPLSPYMDHPGALEHFPSGSFLAPPAL